MRWVLVPIVAAMVGVALLAAVSPAQGVEPGAVVPGLSTRSLDWTVGEAAREGASSGDGATVSQAHVYVYDDLLVVALAGDGYALRERAFSHVLAGRNTIVVPAAGDSRSATTVPSLISTPSALPSRSTVNNAGSPIRSFVTETDQTYYRVFSGQNRTGGFLTGAPPASADDAVRGLALPPGNRADFIQEVTVPAGTRLQSSVATEAFGQPGGLLQFELLDLIDPKHFGAGRPFR